MIRFQNILDRYRERTAALERQSGVFLDGIAWTGGDYVPLGEATIPFVDQGFLHGDMCYDVPSVWDGRFFRLDDHLDRLIASCGKMRLRLPIPRSEVRDRACEMVARAGYRDAYVQFLVTRGNEFVRFKRPEEARNSLFLYCTPYVWIMELEQQRTGGSAVVARTVRRTPPDAFDPTIKNLQWGDLTRGWFEAMDRGADYPILPDLQGYVTEGFGYNVVLVKDGVLRTPDRGVLEGITRRTIIEIAARENIECRLEQIPISALYEADEIFMVSTAGGVMPLTLLDGRPVGDGTVGPITQRLWDAYWALRYDPTLSFEIDYGTA